MVSFSLYLLFCCIFHLILYVFLCLCFKSLFISSSCHFIFSLLTFYFCLIMNVCLFSIVFSQLSSSLFLVTSLSLSSFLISWHLFPYQLVFSLHFSSRQSHHRSMSLHLCLTLQASRFTDRHSCRQHSICHVTSSDM